jgi:hypothetical protein
MTDATEYGVVRNNDDLVANHTPPNVKKDYVKDNQEKITEEVMPNETTENQK